MHELQSVGDTVLELCGDGSARHTLRRAEAEYVWNDLVCVPYADSDIAADDVGEEQHWKHWFFLTADELVVLFRSTMRYLPGDKQLPAMIVWHGAWVQAESGIEPDRYGQILYG